jgi:hypothetical protein
MAVYHGISVQSQRFRVLSLPEDADQDQINVIF